MIKFANISRKAKLLFLVGFFVFANAYIGNQESQAEDDAEEIQESIDKTQKKIDSVQKDLQQNQSELQTTQSQINTTSSLINKTETEISRKETEIKNMEQRIKLDQSILSDYLRELYWNEEMDILLPLAIMSDGWQKTILQSDSLITTKDKVLSLIGKIEETKNDLEGKKGELLEKKEDHEELLAKKQSEKNEIAQDIKEAQATMGELNEKIDKMRGELSELLGSSVSAKDIREAVSIASSATGVRKNFLFGMLSVESSLGKYTGGCTYKESRMSGTRAEYFKSICKSLGYDYKKKKVSCPPKSYSGTGGAMGVAQFMPDTWMGYKSSIASKTGHNPPDPWSLTDGVMAMALKLAKVSGVTSHKKSAECNAAKLYLSGTTSSKYNWYCDRVFYWASEDNYKKLLN